MKSQITSLFKYLRFPVLAIAIMQTELASAQNPIIQTIYSADPAPMVYRDTVYLYVGRDEENAPEKSYLMREYRLYTSVDMVNWTDCGPALRTSEVAWSSGDANAAQCIERNGKFYWYISTTNRKSPGIGIGVLVSDTPYGPFKDPIGSALVSNNMTSYAKHGWDDLDPTVFVDDDGQAYLFWGNGVCYWAKLNPDMISLGSAVTPFDAKDKAMFGPGFTEAPWVYKRKGLYYLLYASGFPESLHYSTARTIHGPWSYKGVLMPLEGGSNTNHPGIIDYKGNSYLFYHNDGLPGAHSYDRSVAVEQFTYNKNGTIPAMRMSQQGITRPLSSLNPYRRVEAETMAFSKGVKVREDKKTGIFITDIHDGDFIKVRNVDFGGKGAATFSASASSRYYGGAIEIHLDSENGQLLGTLQIPYTGEWDQWVRPSTPIQSAVGIHDVYFVFKGRKPHTLFDLDFWQFSEKK